MLYIIYNKNAGHGRKTMQKVMRELSASGTEYRFVDPEKAADHETLQTAGPDDTIVLIGGDGSINRLINSFHVKPAAPVLLIPSGSGNDFARGAGIKKAASRTLSARLDGASARDIDTGAVKVPGHVTRKFAVSCGIGYDAMVCRDINTLPLKKMLSPAGLGSLSYLLLGIRGIFTYKRAGVTLTLSGKSIRLDDFAFLSCHNLPFEGGGFAFAPKADPADGMLDITAVTAKNRLIFTFTLAMSLFRLHTRLPWVHTYRCSAARVETTMPLTFHTDGEVIPDVTSFTVKALPGSLSVFCG